MTTVTEGGGGGEKKTEVLWHLRAESWPLKETLSNKSQQWLSFPQEQLHIIELKFLAYIHAYVVSRANFEEYSSQKLSGNGVLSATFYHSQN